MIIHVYPAGSPQDEEIKTALQSILKQGTLARTLPDVQKWSNLLTAELRQAGFPLGQVLMTQADWQAFSQTGQAVFTAWPGRVSQIVVQNKSRVGDASLRRLIDNALCPHDSLDRICLFQTAHLERTTQLLQDLPGVAMDGAPRFGPGAGTGDVDVTFALTQRGKPVTVGATIDNNGTPSTGTARLGVSVAANNYFGLGEDYALNLYLTNKLMWTGSLTGSLPIMYNGLRLTAGITRQQYTVTADNTSFDGKSTTYSLGTAYPFTRGLDSNVWGAVSLLHSDASVDFSDFGLVTHSTLNSLRFSVQADNGDRAQQLRASQWSGQAAFTVGHQQNDDALDVGPQRAGIYTKLSASGFGKLNLNQRGNLFLTGRVNAQQALNRNLDSSEQLGLGGPTAVRAYSTSEGSVDDGVIANVGAYWQVPIAAGHQIQPGIFIDYGVGRVNHDPWPGWASSYIGVPNVGNVRHLAGYGLSLDWLTPFGATISASVSKAFGFSDGSWIDSGNKPVQYWLSMTWAH